jgi:hypothetical protein
VDAVAVLQMARECMVFLLASFVCWSTVMHVNRVDDGTRENKHHAQHFMTAHGGEMQRRRLLFAPCIHHCTSFNQKLARPHMAGQCTNVQRRGLMNIRCVYCCTRCYQQLARLKVAS